MLGITLDGSLRTKSRMASVKNGKNGSGRLSGKLLDYLEHKYQLLPKDMLSLRVVKSKGSLGNQTVYYIRVYDQDESARNGINIKTYNDLDRRPNLILYDGYILENNCVYITKCN